MTPAPVGCCSKERGKQVLLISLKRPVTLVAFRGAGDAGAESKYTIRAVSLVVEGGEAGEGNHGFRVFFAHTGGRGELVRHLVAKPARDFGTIWGERSDKGDDRRNAARAAFYHPDNLTPVAVAVQDGNIDAIVDEGE